MAALSGTAATPAVSPAAASALDDVDLVNSPAGYPATETWPGAVDPATYTDAGPAGQQVHGAWPAEQFAGQIPVYPAGGGSQDASWLTGHDAPYAAWDSAAGAPFAPSGATDPALHGDYGTGAVARAESVAPAWVTGLSRRVQAGQTFNREAPTQTTIGQASPNGRTDLDQYQDWAPRGAGHDPWTIPAAQRPLMNNLAYEAQATVPAGGYEVAGALPDNSVWSYNAQSYAAPEDPTVAAPTPQVAGSTGFSSGWVLG